jgi:mannose-1-phosphate guanylyltransferase
VVLPRFFINLHYLPEVVKSYIEKYQNSIKICIVYEEKLLGTGGTLLKNKAFFQNEPLMLIHADNLSLFDMNEFNNCYEKRDENVEITMMTFDASRPEVCGIVEIDDRGIVKVFHEKVENPPGNLANGAVYILSPSVFDFLLSLEKEEIDFSTEVLPHFIGRINTFQNDVYHRDIGSVESLEVARREFPAVFIKNRPPK